MVKSIVDKPNIDIKAIIEAIFDFMKGDKNDTGSKVS